MINVERVCNKCGLTVDEESCNRCTEGVCILPNDKVYICGVCGKEMTRLITKIETNTTETIIS